METIYIIQSEHGQYDEHNVDTVCAVVSENKAIDLVTKLTKLVEFNKAFSTRVKEFDAAFDAANPIRPRPEKPSPGENFRRVQDVCCSGKASEADKKEYSRLQKEHLVLIDKYYELSVKWHEEKFALMKAKENFRNEKVSESYVLPEHLIEVKDYLDYATGASYAEDIEFSYYSLKVHS